MVDLGYLLLLLGSNKYCTVVEFLALVAESVFTWDIESFVDLCFDVVSSVTALTEKFQKFISALFTVKLSSVEQIRPCMGLTFLCGWGGGGGGGDKTPSQYIGQTRRTLRERFG